MVQVTKRRACVALTLAILALIPEIHAQRSYDFIIVGAGTGGSALANRLSDNPDWSILLIEAGGVVAASNNNLPLNANRLMLNDRLNYKYKTEPSESYCLSMVNRECNVPQGKGMGGSSIFWDMIYSRGNRRDYDAWRDAGNPGWGYDDVKKYFKRLENIVVPGSSGKIFGKSGPVTVSSVKWRSDVAKAFLEAAPEMGMPVVNYNDRNQTGFSYVQTMIEGGYRQTTNDAYLVPIAGQSNLQIRRRSTVEKLLIDENTKTVTGVQFRTFGISYTALAKKEVILAAGVFGNAKLLMMSGIGPADHLEEVGIKPFLHLPVGKNLMDHVGTGGITFLSGANVIDMTAAFGYYSQVGFYYTHEGQLASPAGAEALAFFDSNDQSDPRDGYPDYELLLTAGSLMSMPELKDKYNLDSVTYDSMFKEVEDRSKDAFMITPYLIRPKSRGQVKLRSNLTTDAPVIIPNYFADPEDVKVMLKAIHTTMRLENTTAFQKIAAEYHDTVVPECVQHEELSDAYWECHMRHFSFPAGRHSSTCRMGPADDPNAVVDARLRVHGIDGLRVIGASTMPFQVAGHPDAVVIMIAEKAADMIKEDNRATDMIREVDV